jgi:hypothetical protein
MSRDEGQRVLWRLLLILPAVGLAAATIAWSGGQCFQPAYAKATSNGDFGCLEFWLNRYQQLIGGFLAIAAAAAAWIIGHRQLGVMGRQALADERSAVQEIARDLSSDWTLVHALRHRVTTTKAYVAGLENMNSYMIEEMLKLLDFSAKADVNPYSQAVLARGSTDERITAKMALVTMLNDLAIGVDDIRRRLRSIAGQHGDQRGASFALLRRGVLQIAGDVGRLLEVLEPALVAEEQELTIERIRVADRLRGIEAMIMTSLR